ncbi:tetratricopeptide repeat protein [Schlesneria paludicola]|uniref:tetratricopeptide repeat protein n=1 Tax=Schlesneria paludicola TaxID=360056 RepID=UPI00029AAAF9|nr:tetratricopeptide repeat protein [Schlesneria paludicola]
MTTATIHPTSPPPTSAAPTAARRWIVNSWVDLALIVLTPLIAAPAVLILSSNWVGVKAETISVIVAAFFATGHHLPGLMRAYGDRELFERFRWRFLLAPPLVFLAYFPLHTYHFDLYRLIILSWATWHGLMQLYGFLRIYDAKVGSTSPATAHWDWLVCLCGFVTPQFLRPDMASSILDHWYAMGAPAIPPWALTPLRWTLLAASIVVVIGFALNTFNQSQRGVKPNPIKLMMLISGIGTWWFAMLCIENLLLSVALFDICHDVQYLAIVWLFNCRRVTSNDQLGRFMKYVFRRGMVLLYLGLIVAYGSIGFVAPLVLDRTVNGIFMAVLFASTILHYYYDGFIWKVREKSNQTSLGLNQRSQTVAPPQRIAGDFTHLLKWAPALVGLALLFATDVSDSPLTTEQKDTLSQVYSRGLTGSSLLPRTDKEREWLYSHFKTTQSIAAAIPDDRKIQLRAAIMLANFGSNDDAVRKLEQLLQQHADFADAYLTLGSIHLYRGNMDQAAQYLQKSLSAARTEKERASANFKLGELALVQHDSAVADSRFAEALHDNPKLDVSIQKLRETIH